MPINKKLKVMFIHIPKTGGTSISKMLDFSTLSNLYFRGSSVKYPSMYTEYSQFFNTSEYINLLTRPLQHFTNKELKKIFGSSINDYYKFSIVRNPYQKIVSGFNRRQLKNIGLPGFENLNTFIDKFLPMENITRSSRFQGHFETQTSYLLDENNVIDPSIEIFKFEDLTKCFDKIHQICPDIPNCHTNASPKYNYKTHYTDETAAKVYEFYKEDFINFGYSATL